jgi:hypothetical protein
MKVKSYFFHASYGQRAEMKGKEAEEEIASCLTMK